jgi:hypothetical protein
MTPALDHAQGWRPARAGEPVRLRHGMPASVAARDNHQFQCPTRPSKVGRVHCRGRSTPRTFSSRTAGGCGRNPKRRRADAILLPALVRRNFTPRTITLDDIHDLRICELTGRQPVLARSAQSVFDHRKAVPAVSAKVDHQSKSSTSAVFDDRNRDRGRLEPCSPNRGIEFPR